VLGHLSSLLCLHLYARWQLLTPGGSSEPFVIECAGGSNMRYELLPLHSQRQLSGALLIAASTLNPTHVEGTGKTTTLYFVLGTARIM
jgi:hypothetical protein